MANIFPDEIGSFTTLMAIHKLTGHHRAWRDDTTHEIVICCSVTPADPLHLILGARYTNWRVDTLTAAWRNNHALRWSGLTSMTTGRPTPAIPLFSSRK